MAREGVTEGVVGDEPRARLCPHDGSEDGRQKRPKCNYDQLLEQSGALLPPAARKRILFFILQHDRQHSFRRDVTGAGASRVWTISRTPRSIGKVPGQVAESRSMSADQMPS